MIVNAVVLAVAVLLGVASIRKLSISRQFRAAVATWSIVPVRGRMIIGTAIPVAEATISALAFVALAFLPTMRAAALGAAAVLFVSFGLVQAAMLVKGSDATCGCFSAGRVNGTSVARAATLGLVCVVALVV